LPVLDEECRALAHGLAEGLALAGAAEALGIPSSPTKTVSA
jgi:hypothetical protein